MCILNGMRLSDFLVQAKHRLLWFGRDVLGRRSLLLRRPSLSDPRFLLASVAPADSTVATEDVHSFQYWEELQCGIHSMSFSSSFIGLSQLHEWEDPLLRKLVLWDRQYVDPSNHSLKKPQQGKENSADSLLKVLRRSVKKRTSDIRKRQQVGACKWLLSRDWHFSCLILQ
jgi:asparagine synthetase B (glutamine-hydrolysing)